MIPRTKHLTDPVAFHLNFKYKKIELTSGASDTFWGLAFDDVWWKSFPVDKNFLAIVISHS